MSARVARPVRELKGFAKVKLKPGEAARVTFSVPVDLLAYYDREMWLAVEAGEYRVIIARRAKDEGLQATVNVEKGFVLPTRRKLLSEVHVERASIHR